MSLDLKESKFSDSSTDRRDVELTTSTYCSSYSFSGFLYSLFLACGMLHQLYVPYFSSGVTDESKINPYVPSPSIAPFRELTLFSLGGYHFNFGSEPMRVGVDERRAKREPRRNEPISAYCVRQKKVPKRKTATKASSLALQRNQASDILYEGGWEGEIVMDWD